MKTVWKYPFPENVIDATFVVPDGGIFLRTAVQNGTLCMWFCVISDLPKEQRRFLVTGTGHPVPSDAKYCGSCSDGPFEWHVWEL